jgi:uncharacterized protein (TIGR02246 family)
MEFMRLICLILVADAISLGVFALEPKVYRAKDLNALNSLPAKFEHYWNIDNMDSMGTLLRENVDFVNVAGTWFRGKAATVNDHKDSHSMMFKSSTFTNDSVNVRYVSPDIAIMHVGWGISGDFDPDGTPRKSRHGIFTWVISKENGHWLILAASNVNIREAPGTKKQ